MKGLFITIGLFFSFFNSFGQEMQISNNLDMSVEKIKFRKTTRDPEAGGWSVAPKGKKWLIVEAVFKTRNTKKEKLYLNKFVLLFGENNESDELLDEEYYIKIRKKRKEKIKFAVDKNFTTGKLLYQNKELIEITIPKDSKVGEFKILN